MKYKYQITGLILLTGVVSFFMSYFYIIAGEMHKNTDGTLLSESWRVGVSILSLLFSLYLIYKTSYISWTNNVMKEFFSFIFFIAFSVFSGLNAGKYYYYKDYKDKSDKNHITDDVEEYRKNFIRFIIITGVLFLFSDIYLHWPKTDISDDPDRPIYS